MLALAVLALAISLVAPERVPRRGVARAATALLPGAAIPIGTNYPVGGRLAWTPGGYRLDLCAYAGGRHRHPLSQRSLSEPLLKLCAYRNELPRNADDFLWNDGVFDKLGRFAGLDDEMRRIGSAVFTIIR